MNTLIKVSLTLLLILTCAFGAFGQSSNDTNTGPPGTAIYQPQYFVAAGVGFNKTESPQAIGWMTLGAKISDLNFTTTTLTMTSRSSVINQDFGRYLVQQDKFTLAAIAGGGVAASAGSIGGDVGAGVALSYDISRLAHTPHTFFTCIVKADKSSGVDVRPTFKFGVAMGLGN